MNSSLNGRASEASPETTQSDEQMSQNLSRKVRLVDFQSLSDLNGFVKYCCVICFATSTYSVNFAAMCCLKPMFSSICCRRNFTHLMAWSFSNAGSHPSSFRSFLEPLSIPRNCAFIDDAKQKSKKSTTSAKRNLRGFECLSFCFIVVGSRCET